MNGTEKLQELWEEAFEFLGLERQFAKLGNDGRGGIDLVILNPSGGGHKQYKSISSYGKTQSYLQGLACGEDDTSEGTQYFDWFWIGYREQYSVRRAYCRIHDPRFYENSEILQLWNQFQEVPLDEDGYTLDEFIHFPEYTDPKEIIRWFDVRYPGGIGAIILKGLSE